MARHGKVDVDYDWLNDPFDDKRTEEEEREAAKMPTGSKVALGIGCLAVAIILIAVTVVSCSSMVVLLGA